MSMTKKPSLELRTKLLAWKRMLKFGETIVLAQATMSQSLASVLASIKPRLVSITTKCSMVRAWSWRCQDPVSTRIQRCKRRNDQRPWTNPTATRISSMPALFSTQVKSDLDLRELRVSTMELALRPSSVPDLTWTRTTQWSRRVSTCRWSTLTSSDQTNWLLLGR